MARIKLKPQVTEKARAQNISVNGKKYRVTSKYPVEIPDDVLPLVQGEYDVYESSKADEPEVDEPSTEADEE